MSQDLLVTKLYIPPVRPNLVPRPQLIQLLHDGWQQGKKLTLVSASAGYGKTTLVSAWLHGLQVKSTWLSLDKTDNDPAQFLVYLIAALQRIDERIGENTRALLQSPGPLPTELVLTTLINEIANMNIPFVLVLDDYHVIESIIIHQQLDFLVEHAPPQMHLIIVTREDPPLPLARLRASGQVVEIRQADLRFSMAECEDFYQRNTGVNLTQDDIALLERRTEGWIAGLQLAALSMRGCADPAGFIKAFSGSSHYVLEYLIEEVFDRQTPEEQDFLLKTSILERLSGPLCDAVVSRTDSNRLLDRLEHANSFIIPLDQPRSWYRYHQLFAELLRQRLRSTAAASENELHHRASRWFSREGLLPEAIQHALAASDWEGAAKLISDNTVLMLRRGELHTLLGWLRSLPDEMVCQHPQLCRDYGWALTLTGQLDAAEPYLQRAETAATGDDALLGTIIVAQAYNWRVRGDNDQAIEHARRALSLLPEEDHLSRSLVAVTLGLAYWNRGNFPEAEETFAQADQIAQLSHNHYARMTALTYLGIIQAVYGRLHQAARLCRQVIQSGGHSPTIAPAYVELGALLYEWNELESASQHLRIGIEQSQQIGNLLIQSDGLRTLAVVQQASGQADAALTTLQKADQLAESRQVSPITHWRNAACHVQLALAQNDLAEAAYWAGQAPEAADSSLLFPPRFDLTPARLLLGRGEKIAAGEKLSMLYQTAHQAGWNSAEIEVRALQSLAADTPSEAIRFLEDALRQARQEGFIRTFVDKGEPMKALLERMKTHSGELKEYCLTLLAAFETTARISNQGALVEPLSERELEVLQLISQGLSNAEIARRLVISVGTVKSHVHSIIGKLGVTSRTQAVARARELALLINALDSWSDNDLRNRPS